ncbi:MAG: 2-C-methyl-D-erythritol 4-phosphate cytidylyltransferase [Deltaproteobacteria bacterium]|nr:2-C-methyl-D-erythritol 4-phosphate cytidylyltransferase [Deltaproteobacteria bacterium]
MVFGIIVAAGKSLRMGGPIPKQYRLLGDLPVLSRTLSAFDDCPAIDEIILVLPAGDQEMCRQRVIDPVSPSKKITPIAGGEKRQESVYQGLLAVRDQEAIVVIHDGVRPFIQTRHIDACIRGARKTGAVVLGEPVCDTLKMIGNTTIIKKTVDREHIWSAQTPQAFQYPLIKAAHDRALRDGYMGTDDAVLLERLGTPVKMIPGSRTNIKITTRVDLAIARAFITDPGILQAN